MKSKELQCAVTVGMSAKEKSQLVATARDLDVPYYFLMRRLIRYILDGKIEWTELFRQSNELAVEDKLESADKVFVRTQLSTDRYSAFARLAEEWGSTTGIVLRRLMLLYIAGKIERRAIWY
jgi:hypothetical protein